MGGARNEERLPNKALELTASAWGTWAFFTFCVLSLFVLATLAAAQLGPLAGFS